MGRVIPIPDNQLLNQGLLQAAKLLSHNEIRSLARMARLFL
jgi:hypothetical protein